jgi:hypothetical protein
VLPGLALGAFFVAAYLSSLGKVRPSGSLAPALQAPLWFLVPFVAVVALYSTGLLRRAKATDKPRQAVNPWFLVLTVLVLAGVLLSLYLAP